MFLENIKEIMDSSVSTQGDEYIFGRKLQSRYHTFKYVINHLLDLKKDKIKILELGTSRSFVSAGIDGCLSTNEKFWHPNNPELWDHGAGMFTYIIPKVLKDNLCDFELHTIDIDDSAISICKTISKNIENIYIHQISSTDFLSSTDIKFDLIYMDTAETNEFGAKLHLEDANIIIKRNLLTNDGIILIDDVRVPWFVNQNGYDWNLGKGKYSIPYFISNGFTHIKDEYQSILKIV